MKAKQGQKQYSDELTVEQAQREFLWQAGFGRGTYDERWAKFELGPFPLLLPNIPARRRALPFHDLHHVLTGYDTTFMGEAQLAAWELGSGCKKEWVAWVLNTLGVCVGSLLDRRKVLRAFLYGKRCRNLYGRNLNEELMQTRLGRLREELHLSVVL